MNKKFFYRKLRLIAAPHIVAFVGIAFFVYTVVELAAKLFGFSILISTYLFAALLWFFIWFLFWPTFQNWLARTFPTIHRFALQFTEDSIPLVKPLQKIIHPSASEKYEPSFPLTAQYPAAFADLTGASFVARSWWDDDNPKVSLVESWYEKNSRTTVVLKDSDGDICGYFDFFPVEDAFIEQLNRKVLTEENLFDFIIPEQGPNNPMLTAEHIYIGGIAISKSMAASSSAPILRAALLHASQYLIRDVLIRPRLLIEKNQHKYLAFSLHAVAFTVDGKRICESLGFEYVGIVAPHGLSAPQGQISETSEAFKASRSHRLFPEQYFRLEVDLITARKLVDTRRGAGLRNVKIDRGEDESYKFHYDFTALSKSKKKWQY